MRFVVVIVAALVAVTALFYNEGAQPVSIVDGTCAQKWIPRAQNDPALLCYIKTRPERLCQDSERARFVLVVHRYVNDQDAFRSDLKQAMQSYQLGDVRDTSAYDKPEKSDFVRAMNVEMIPTSKMAGFIRDLATKGYITESDFGWWPDSMISDAFEDVGEVKTMCNRQ